MPSALGGLACWSDRDDAPVSFRYNSTLRNLSMLQLTGSHTEARDYVAVVARVLSRWAQEDGSPACAWWSPVQDTLIASVCGLAFHDQVRARAGRLWCPSGQGLRPGGS